MKQHRKLKNILYKFIVTKNWDVCHFDYRLKNHKEPVFRPVFYNAVERYNRELEFVNSLTNTNKVSEITLDLKSAFDLFIELKMTDEELLKLATEIKGLRPVKQKTYQREKDNSIWGKSFSRDSGRNKNKIRFPKKCRKTAWKRFYKLFPHLKNETI